MTYIYLTLLASPRTAAIGYDIVLLTLAYERHSPETQRTVRCRERERGRGREKETHTDTATQGRSEAGSVGGGKGCATMQADSSTIGATRKMSGDDKAWWRCDELGLSRTERYSVLRFYPQGQHLGPRAGLHGLVVRQR